MGRGPWNLHVDAQIAKPDQFRAYGSINIGLNCVAVGTNSNPGYKYKIQTGINTNSNPGLNGYKYERVQRVRIKIQRVHKKKSNPGLRYVASGTTNLHIDQHGAFFLRRKSTRIT